MPETPSLLITGATSQIGGFLLARLQGVSSAVFAVSRGKEGADQSLPGVRWVRANIERGDPLPAAHTLIHLAPLGLLIPLLPQFFAQGGRRVIAFGTTSRFSKARSAYPKEQDFATRLLADEAALARLCASAKVPWTLFRPTLIYGAGKDRNISLIARIIRRYGVFPLLGEAGGLRQPVHADDLAAACVAVLDNPTTFNKAYDLCGGETLSYQNMVVRIFEALGRPPRLVQVPMPCFALAMRLLACLPRYRDFNVEMARRMNEDLVFDHTDARRDFGFTPRRFCPTAGLAKR